MLNEAHVSSGDVYYNRERPFIVSLVSNGPNVILDLGCGSGLRGDILEHLKYPYSVVKKVPGWLKADGRFICSVPNVRYWRILTDLIFRGAWDYREAASGVRTSLLRCEFAGSFWPLSARGS
jgi:hypothetical protein